MKRRKPNNSRTRVVRAMRAILNTNHVAVVNIDPSGKQGLINWKSCKNIAGSQLIADAVCDIPHQWVIYLAAFCVDQFGKRYVKATEIAPAGMYTTERLNEVLEAFYTEHVASCNPNHVIGSGWIANPSGVSLTEEQADKVFDAVGAWSQNEAAA